ncbi:MAG: helix-turn-helix transcriptional regulator [Clostridia bacterium]|nr:helix-turn-helix transcriptional regulator [Clostridia bacterium]
MITIVIVKQKLTFVSKIFFMIQVKDDFFAKNLKKLRESKGFSQAKLAKELGVSPAIISLWEQNKREITKYYLKIICQYFEIGLDELVLEEYICEYKE